MFEEHLKNLSAFRPLQWMKASRVQRELTSAIGVVLFVTSQFVQCQRKRWTSLQLSTFASMFGEIWNENIFIWKLIILCIKTKQGIFTLHQKHLAAHGVSPSNSVSLIPRQIYLYPPYGAEQPKMKRRLSWVPRASQINPNTNILVCNLYLRAPRDAGSSWRGERDWEQQSEMSNDVSAWLHPVSFRSID